MPQIVKSVEDLLSCSRHELTRQANILLYGHPDVLEEAMYRQIFFRRIYMPADLTDPLRYDIPKNISQRMSCEKCGRLRADCSGLLCRFCYRLRARLRYFEKRDAVAYWDQQMRGGWESGIPVGVTMPITEWWSDRDLPARPKRLAIVDWAA